LAYFMGNEKLSRSREAAIGLSDLVVHL